MTKTNKKILLGLVSLGVAAAPIAAVVSCGSSPGVLKERQKAAAEALAAGEFGISQVNLDNLKNADKPVDLLKAINVIKSQFSNDKAKLDKVIAILHLVSQSLHLGQVHAGAREFVSYESIISPTFRTLDLPYSAVSPSQNSAITTSPFRMTAKGADDIHLKPDLEITESSHLQSFVQEFNTVEKVTLNGINYSSITPELNTALGSDLTSTELKLTIDSGKKYVDNKGEETKYVIHGMDYFVSFLRQMYSDKTVREKGKYGLPKLSDNEINKLKKIVSGYSSLKMFNKYLLDLYNIDIVSTISSNLSAISNGDYDSMIIKFNGTPTKFALHGISSFLSLMSLDRLLEKNQNFKDLKSNPDKFLQLYNFGISKITNNSYDIENEVYAGRFYLSKSDWSDSTGEIILKKNMHFIKSSWVNDSKTFLQLRTIPISDAADKDALALQRKQGFTQGDELLLNEAAASDASISSSHEVSKWAKNLHLEKDGVSSKFAQYAVNPVYAITNNEDSNRDYNSLGYKMMYGTDDLEKIKTDGNVMNEFYFGDGEKVRGIMNAAVNSKSWGQRLYGNGSLISSSNTFAYTTHVGGASSKTIQTAGLIPSYVDTFEKQKSWAASNGDDKINALKTGKFAEASAALNGLATKVGASVTNKATIPVMFYNLSADANPRKEDKSRMTDYLKVLNLLSDKVTFKATESYKGASGKTAATKRNSHRSLITFMGVAGKDYDSGASLLVQTINDQNMQLPLLRAALGIAHSEIKTIDGHFASSDVFDVSDMKAYLDAHAAKYDKLTQAIASKVSFDDIAEYVNDKYPSTIPNEEQIEFIKQSDTFMQAYFLNLASQPGKQDLINKYFQLVQNTSLGLRSMKSFNFGSFENDPTVQTQRIYVNPKIIFTKEYAQATSINFIDTKYV